MSKIEETEENLWKVRESLQNVGNLDTILEESLKLDIVFVV